VLQDTNWVIGGRRVPRRAWGYGVRRYSIAWKSSAFHAGPRGLPADAVDYFSSPACSHLSPGIRRPPPHPYNLRIQERITYTL